MIGGDCGLAGGGGRVGGRDRPKSVAVPSSLARSSSSPLVVLSVRTRRIEARTFPCSQDSRLALGRRSIATTLL